MKHTNNNDIFKNKGKKVTAVLVATTLVATCGYAALSRKLENNFEIGVEDTDNKPFSDLLILTEDFDINDVEAVKERAKEIYDISEKEYSKADIANMIYILGEKYDSITFPISANTDKEKFEYLQELALLLGTILDDDLYKYTDALVNGEMIIEKQESVPCVYMFMATNTEEKQNAIEVARLYYEQRENVRMQDTAAMQITAEKYYELYASLEDMDLSASDKVALYKQFSAINPLFTPLLNLEQAEDLDDALGKCAAATNIIFQTAAEDLDISEILEEGNYGKEISLGEKYNASDAKDAVTHPAVVKDNTKSTTRVVEEGGKPVKDNSGKHEVLNKPTTSVHKEEFTVKVPSTTKPTEKVEEGGKVVEEETFVVDIGSYEGTTSVVVEEGGEIIEERYVDADAAKAEELASTFTLG